MPARSPVSDRERFAQWKALELAALFEHEADGSAAWLQRVAHVLFLKLYEGSLTGVRLTKSQTYAFLPFRHAASCIKVLDAAEAHGFVSFEKDRADARKQWVVPTRKLIDMTERDIDHSIQQLFEFVKTLSGTRLRPKRG